MEVPTIAGLEIQDAAVDDGKSPGEDPARGARLQSQDRPARSGEPFESRSDFVLDQEPSLSAKVQLRDHRDGGSGTQRASTRRSRRSTSRSPARAIRRKAFRCRFAPMPSRPMSVKELYRLDGSDREDDLEGRRLSRRWRAGRAASERFQRQPRRADAGADRARSRRRRRAHHRRALPARKFSMRRH